MLSLTTSIAKEPVASRVPKKHFARGPRTAPQLLALKMVQIETTLGANMITFAIIQIDDGYEVIEVLAGQSPENAAAAEGGQLFDAGPYHTYTEAHDAVTKLLLSEKADRRSKTK